MAVYKSKRKSYRGRDTVRKSYKKAKYAPKIRVSQLPKCVRPEMKCITKNVEGISMSALTENQLVIMPFSHVTNGAAVNQRVGNEICLKSIHLKGHLYNRSTVANTMLVRIAIIQDTKDNAQFFTGANCLIKSNAPVSLGSLGAESSYLAWNKSRYNVAFDKLYEMGSSNTNASDVQLFNVFTKLRGEAEFSYTTGAPGAINKGNWQVVMWACDPDNAGQSTSSVTGFFQICGYYTDP